MSELLTYEECKRWAEKFSNTLWKDLALAVAAEHEDSPMRVMRSLFEEVEKRNEEIEELKGKIRVLRGNLGDIEKIAMVDSWTDV